MIIYLTGQPGSGKTTICKHAMHDGDFHIDGDDIRELFQNKDFSREGRRYNVDIVQKISKYLNSKGKNVWISMVSPDRDQRDSFKQEMKNDIVEVYVHTSEKRGKENFFVRYYQPPIFDYLYLDTTNISVYMSLKLIYDYVTNKFNGNKQSN